MKRRRSIIKTLGRLLSPSPPSGPEQSSSSAGDQSTRRMVAPSERVCGITDVGCVRPHNEDAFHVRPDGRLLIVADGMGGHAAGEVASALAVETVVELVDGIGYTAGCAAGRLPETTLQEAFETAHRRVLDTARTREGCQGMGTTLIVGWVRGDTLYTCHVGDVRAYVLAENGLEQITQDHSVVGLMVRAGQLTPEAARSHPARNEILQALGMPSGIVPEVHAVPLRAGDQVLLCSDGLWEEVGGAEIAALLAEEGSLHDRAIKLVDRANAAGGRDNITVVLYGHVAKGETPGGVL